MTGIVKRFGPVTALEGVDFRVRRGEVHALLGENGAGKTTLMNIACGILRGDAGTIRIRGETASIRSPQDGYRHGLGIVHQNYRLIRNFTVAENLHVGWNAAPRVASTGTLRARTAEFAERYGLAIDPDARIYELSAGEAQRVAILRTLAQGARTLVLDEPTALLTPQEADSLFRIIRAMVSDGASVVFVSHKLHEVMEIGDHVTVLRLGQNVVSKPKQACSIEMLARDMVGGDVVAAVRRPPARLGERLLAVRGVSVAGASDTPALRDVHIEVRSGEIVGIAGVAGNGQSELANVVTGLLRPTSGAVEVGGRDMTGSTASAFMSAGVGHIPEHIAIGMALRESVETNAVMKSIDEPALATKIGLVLGRLRKFTSELLNAAGLSAIAPRRRVNTLSGGQMQRLLVQRELVAGGRLIVAVHPSRGLDVAATERVHSALIAAVERGAGVLLISEDLDEVLKLSDRIDVLYEGSVQGAFDRADAEREKLGLLMGGAAATVIRSFTGNAEDG
jgi:general nucleoside transport system ATP-binding protein